MPDAESPKTLFEVIYLHWPTQPEVVVHDNSCHAMTYMPLTMNLNGSEA